LTKPANIEVDLKYVSPRMPVIVCTCLPFKNKNVSINSKSLFKTRGVYILWSKIKGFRVLLKCFQLPATVSE